MEFKYMVCPSLSAFCQSRELRFSFFPCFMCKIIAILLKLLKSYKTKFNMIIVNLHWSWTSIDFDKSHVTDCHAIKNIDKRIVRSYLPRKYSIYIRRSTDRFRYFFSIYLSCPSNQKPTCLLPLLSHLLMKLQRQH